MSQIRWDELSEARQLARLGKSLSRAARTRLQWMLFYLFNGRNVARTCRHFGISRQTFYRWRRRFDRHDLTTLEGRSHRPRNTRQPTWTTATAERVLALRKQYPCWGKDKLVVLLAREKLYVSVSMVGRILAALKRTGALHEPPKSAVLLRQHRKLRKRPWAIRKPKYWPIEYPGDLVEIDTKEIRMHRGILLKHFTARDVVSRWDVVRSEEHTSELQSPYDLVCRLLLEKQKTSSGPGQPQAPYRRPESDPCPRSLRWFSSGLPPCRQLPGLRHPRHQRSASPTTRVSQPP